jgi:hypothetical protein
MIVAHKHRNRRIRRQRGHRDTLDPPHAATRVLACTTVGAAVRASIRCVLNTTPSPQDPVDKGEPRENKDPALETCTRRNTGEPDDARRCLRWRRRRR